VLQSSLLQSSGTSTTCLSKLIDFLHFCRQVTSMSLPESTGSYQAPTSIIQLQLYSLKQHQMHQFKLIIKVQYQINHDASTITLSAVPFQVTSAPATSSLSQLATRVSCAFSPNRNQKSSGNRTGNSSVNVSGRSSSSSYRSTIYSTSSFAIAHTNGPQAPASLSP
jgi:hypothetical protein